MSKIPRPKQPQTLQFHSGGTVPNNPALPLLLYRKAFDASVRDLGSAIEQAFLGNGWSASWRGDVYTFHHYHSNTHEALGVHSGRAQLMLGGPQGETVEVSEGDLIVVPAGVGHKRIDAGGDFEVVGAYPNGESYDLLREDDEATDAIRERIAAVPIPDTDPLYGHDGPLRDLWGGKR